MEQQEEKKRKVYRKRRAQSKSVSSFPLEIEEQEKKKEDLATEEERSLVYRRRKSKSTLSFPLDLTSEILLRLPARSVFRFRCVSKLWSSITTDSYFIKSFESRSSTALQPSLLLCFIKGEKLFVSSIPQHHQISKESYSFSQPIFDRYHMEFPEEYSYFPPTESVHGLICFRGSSGNPIVWNSSKRKLLTLPRPRKSWETIGTFLGYDPIEGKHKLMCIPSRRICDVCRVLTLGSTKKSWRSVKTNHKHRSSYYNSGRCINGVIYYTAYICKTGVWVIMSFDVRFENFGMIDLPSDIHRDTLLNYGGRLACVGKLPRKYTLWILEDAEKDEWSSQDFLSPFWHYNKSMGISLKLKGFTHAGELIFAPDMFSKYSYLLFCDPVRNSFRRFEFKGIADDGDEDFFHKGLQIRPIYVLYTFPNHI